jgi:hypothetical protein
VKAIRFIPLAFIAGYHGFALFAPYAAMVLVAAHVMHRRRRKLALATV